MHKWFGISDVQILSPEVGGSRGDSGQNCDPFGDSFPKIWYLVSFSLIVTQGKLLHIRLTGDPTRRAADDRLSDRDLWRPSAAAKTSQRIIRILMSLPLIERIAVVTKHYMVHTHWFSNNSLRSPFLLEYELPDGYSFQKCESLQDSFEHHFR
jgi:hypothetical protein